MRTVLGIDTSSSSGTTWNTTWEVPRGGLVYPGGGEVEESPSSEHETEGSRLIKKELDRRLEKLRRDEEELEKLATRTRERRKAVRQEKVALERLELEREMLETYERMRKDGEV